MPTRVGSFFGGLHGGWPIALALLLLAAVLLLAAFRILHLRRSVAARDERLAGEAERRGAAEDRTRWVSDHDVHTELPRLHHFIERAAATLGRGRPGAADKRIVALKLSELDETIRSLGHDAGLEMARGFAQRLTSLGFDAYGLSGRDVFLVLGDGARIDAELRSKPGCEVTITVYAIDPAAVAAADLDVSALSCDVSSAGSTAPLAAFTLFLLLAGRRRRR